VTAGISPAPAVGVRRLALSDTNPGHGFVLIMIPRSLAGPHAVVVNATSLRYPVRHGTTTRYLSAPEVAAAHRQRLLSEAEQPHRAAEAEQQAQAHLDDGDVWLQVSVTPELPGSMRIDTALLRSVQRELAGRPTTLFSSMGANPNTRAGYRRIMASGQMHSGPPLKYDLTELHSDGAGTWAHALWDMNRQARAGTDQEGVPYLLNDEAVVEWALSGLALLVAHARDRAQAAGQALVRVQLLNRSGRTIALGHTRQYGFAEALGGSFALRDHPVAAVLADLDDVAGHVPDLLTALHAALTDVVQSFGVAELAQLTEQGQVRRPYWSRERRPRLEAWAEQHGVDIVDETL
jgi:hypothetical protein